jgi:ATP-dependent Clp protease ATP-binding subunit ClpB
VRVTDTAKNYIVEAGSDPHYGARPLKRYLQSKVETLLARKIIATDVAPDTTLVIDRDENGLFVR